MSPLVPPAGTLTSLGWNVTRKSISTPASSPNTRVEIGVVERFGADDVEARRQ